MPFYILSALAAQSAQKHSENKKTVLPFSLDPRIEISLQGISRHFQHNVFQKHKTSGQDNFTTVVPAKSNKHILRMKLNAPTLHIRKCLKAPPPTVLCFLFTKKAMLEMTAHYGSSSSRKFNVLQKGQQVHFNQPDLQNLIQYFVDWRIKPFARVSALCSGPCCRKQISLGCVEFGRDPPSF